MKIVEKILMKMKFYKTTKSLRNKIGIALFNCFKNGSTGPMKLVQLYSAGRFHAKRCSLFYKTIEQKTKISMKLINEHEHQTYTNNPKYKKADSEISLG